MQHQHVARPAAAFPPPNIPDADHRRRDCRSRSTRWTAPMPDSRSPSETPPSFRAATIPTTRARRASDRPRMRCRRIESDRASWQASYQRVARDAVTHRPARRGLPARDAVESQHFDRRHRYLRGARDSCSRRVAERHRRLRVRARRLRDQQDDNAPAARAADRRRDQPAGARGVRRRADPAARSPAAAGVRRPSCRAFAVDILDLSAVGADHPYDGVDVAAPPRALTGDVSAAY